MPSVSVLGGTGGGVVVIPTTSAALTAAAQSALSAVSARVTAGTEAMFAYAGFGTLPQLQRNSNLVITGSTSLTIPIGQPIDAITVTSADQVSIVDNAPTPVTVVSGSGGLLFDRSGTGAGPALILATGGYNTINLGTGAATVGVDGAATVNALGGAASIMAAAGGSALLRIGGADTVSLGGTDTVTFAANASAASVTLQDGAAVVFSALTGVATPLVHLAAGTQVVGTAAGSTASVSGSVGGMMLVSAWGGRTFVNPGAANVTVFAGSGSETLFGAGDESLPGVKAAPGAPLLNAGSDFVFGGNGYFHGGSGPLNLLISSAASGAATLVGGGTIDILFSQGAGDSLRGAAGTVIMNAAGFAEPGFSVAGASGGNVLDAGASNAFMFGAAWGANTIVSGSGAATVFGNHGATGHVGNFYADGGGGGALAILDFLPGADVVSLRGANVASVATVTASQQGTPGTFVALSDGTTIGFIDEFLTPDQIAATFR